MMGKLDSILDQFIDIASNPKKAVEDYRAQTGKGAIGIFPVYSPEEIVYATGCLPVGLWGGQRSIKKASTYLPAYACSIMQSVMELQLDGVYDDLEAVIFSSPCDTLKCMGQKWKGKCPSIQFVHPQNRGLESANIFLAEEYKLVRSKLEQILGIEITDEAINKAIDVYNENRRIMRTFTKVAANYPQTIDPIKRHAIMKARFFMDRLKHTQLVRELLAQLEALPAEQAKGKKVILTGIMAEPNELLEIFKELDVSVVADDLAQESRQFRVDVPDGEEPLYRLAKAWQDMYGCSLATDRGKYRVKMLVDMQKETDADAVIVCMMKFCEPEEYDYPIIYKRFDEEDIPSLLIEIDQQSASFEQARTRIQSFVEMI
jgi:bcr-type benzoyl-CoA reductase subunit C